MNSAVGFLLFAVAVSVVGGGIIALRHRRPTSFTTSIDDFSERMSALAPEPGTRPGPSEHRPEPLPGANGHSGRVRVVDEAAGPDEGAR